jgi:4-amino-4-deoxy-L-arabinose transferase-like glycosyltransferase
MRVIQSLKTRYIHSVRELLRNHKRFFILATLAGIALRLFFILRFPSVTTDSFIYGDIAKNWLRHGVYAVSDGATLMPTYIRLPGYPAFLAAMFSIFGMEHYHAVLFVQLVVDLGTCLIIADIGRRLVSPRTARIAFLLAALCPFLANYTAAALTETWEIFFTVAALDLAIVAITESDGGKLTRWLGCGGCIAAAILLRPDGGLLLVETGFYLAWMVLKRVLQKQPYARLIAAGLIVAVTSLAPLVPWTLRNIHTMHRFQPLAPRYANEENEFVPVGFNNWVKTWIVDYASVEELYWPVPGSPIDADKLPSRAFDSEQQQDETESLIEDYNNLLHVSPALDARFEHLAEQRIHNAPFRYHVWLPLARVADMWLRPRTEMLPSDTRWWEFDDDLRWSILAVSLGLIGVFYVGAGIAGMFWGRLLPPAGLLLLFVLLRSGFLSTLENPEPRYTLECYPVIIVFAAALLARKDQGCGASN